MFSLTSYRTASADLMSGRSLEAALAGRTPRPNTHASPSAAATRRPMPLLSFSLIAFMSFSMPSSGVESTTDPF